MVIGVLLLLVSAAYVALQSKYVQTAVISKITQNISEKTGTEISIRRVNISFFRKIIVSDVYLADKQNDTLFFINKIVADIDSLSFKHKKISFSEIQLKKPVINVDKTDSAYNFDFLLDLLPESKTDTSTSAWAFTVKGISIENGQIEYNQNGLPVDIQQLTSFKNVDLKISALKILPENEICVNVEKFSFNTGSTLHLNDFSAHIDYRQNELMVKSLKTHTKHSRLQSDSIKIDFIKFFETGSINDIIFDAQINNLDFGFGDIAFVLDLFEGYDFRAMLEGRVHGSLADMHCRDFKLSVGDFTKLYGNIYLNGLPDFKSTYIFFDLNESYANLMEIRNLSLPPKIKNAINNMPDFFNNLGEFSYSGNFTGFVDDFVAYGTAYSNLGKVSTDISFKPQNKGKLTINGQLNAENLKVGEIFDSEILNELSLSGSVDGTIDKESNFDLIFNGMVQALDINNYRFNNIDLDGTISNEQFVGMFSVNDQYLKMGFNGKLDLVPQLPVFEFIANVEHVNLDALNVFNNPGAVASALIDANFEGDKIDNVKGQLSLTNLKYKNNIDELEISKATLYNNPGTDYSVIRFRSDLVDGDITGHYNFANIHSSLIRFYKHYLPSSVAKNVDMTNDVNHFDYIFQLKNLEPILRLIDPNYYLDPDITLSGYYHPAQNNFLLETFVPFARIGNKGVEQLSLKFLANKQQLLCDTKCEKFRLNDQLNLYNLTLASQAQNDSLIVDLNWNNLKNKNNYSGSIGTLTYFVQNELSNPNINVSIKPSAVVIADSVWNIDESFLKIDSTAIDFNGIHMFGNDQHIYIEGGIAQNETTALNVNLLNLDFGLIQPLMGRNDFSGKINAKAQLKDLYRKFMLNLDLNIERFAYQDGLLGDLKLESNWDPDSNNLVSYLSIVNNNKELVEASGIIDPINSRLDLGLLFDHTPVTVLDFFMPSTFNHFHGAVKGNVHLHGSLSHLMMDGMLTPVEETGLGLTFLNTVYSFTDPVYFRNDSIIFSNLNFYDQYKNTAVLNGSISHHTFNKMKFNMAVETNNLLVLNTTSEHNEYFYGKGFAKGNVVIRGDMKETLIGGDIRTEKGTSINIPFETSENAVKYDFIEFINIAEDETDKRAYNVVTSGLNMDFDVEITPEAKVQLIFNSQIGDVIKGEGNGNLKVKIDKNFNLNLYGNYIIEQGDYLFTLQNVINKRFSIQRGSSIEWVGDPYDAIIDIAAVYGLKTTLKDLIVNTYEDIDLTRRVQVDCIIKLTESLTQPRIDFSIDLPSSEERVKDQVNQLIVTSEDVNKQVISLLMLGRFYTPEYFAGRPTTEAGVDLVGATASDLISNQLSNWFSQITDWADFGFKWRPGNDFTDSQIELALSTQILNDRVTINGNIANNVNSTNANNNNNFVGDFDVKVKLTENGRLQFKAYHHSNDYLNYIIDPYTQGVGFTYSDEFNSFDQLLKRYKEGISRRFRKLFKKK
ncbi:MAG: translocation/assembly module TamB domain-containing protein [Prolixibacteraceae bacterium]|nr:translocation/assembly module TamB domain-containing protein [Prolixibacteraceae bacterium]